jgi:DNA-binding NarL/FixJ family response regulator
MRVLVVDDHLPFRDGLVKLLELIPGASLVATAAGADEAVHRAHVLQPDIILMDRQNAGTQRHRRHPATPGHQPHIGHCADHVRRRRVGLRRDARRRTRLPTQGRTPGEITRALGTVANGDAIFSAGIAQRLVQYFAGLPAFADARAFRQLSEREREVLELISQGLSNAESPSGWSCRPNGAQPHVPHFAKLSPIGPRPSSWPETQVWAQPRDRQPTDLLTECPSREVSLNKVAAKDEDSSHSRADNLPRQFHRLHRHPGESDQGQGLLPPMCLLATGAFCAAGESA